MFLEQLPTNKELFLECENGASKKDLAKKYGCSVGTIYYRISVYKKENKQVTLDDWK